MLVINLFGGPGCGKSTGASYIFSKLKLSGINCELVTEFAKQLVWENRAKTFTDQYYIFAKQHHRLLMIKDQVDVAVVDSPLLLNLVYGRVNNDCPDCFYQLVHHLNSQWDNMNFFIMRYKQFNPVGRVQTKEEAEVVDDEVHKMLRDNNVPYEWHIGNESGYAHIVSKVQDYLEAVNSRHRSVLGCAHSCRAIDHCIRCNGDVYNYHPVGGEYEDSST